MFMIHIQHGVPMCVIDNAVELPPETEGELHRSNDDVWTAHGCLFCFGSLKLQKSQQRMSIYNTFLVQRLKPLKPI